MAPWKSSMALLHRSVSLFAGVMIMMGVGSFYALSAWNAQLKTFLHFTQGEISLISSMASFGAYLSICPGFVFDRMGMKRSIFWGGVILAFIYLILYEAITEYPQSVTPMGIGLCLAAVGQASCFGIFSSMVSNEGLFGKRHRGKIMSLLASAYSGGGAFFGFVYHHEFDKNVGGYFRFMAIFLLLVCLFGWLTLYEDIHRNENQTDATLKKINIEEEEDVDENMTMLVVSAEAISGEYDHHPHGGPHIPEVTGMEMLSDARFWLLFFPVLILIGAGLFIMSNISFIVEALDGPMDQVPMMIALFSAGNMISRIVTGAVSDHFLDQCPRAYFAALSAICTALTQIVFLILPPIWLIVPVTLAGIAEGIMFGTFPVIIRESFGIQHYGKNYGFISLANAIGFPLFLSPIASFFYHLSSVTIDGVEKCFGMVCFQPVFLLVICLCIIAFMCSLKLASMQQYRHIQ
jgi:MFS family permease